MNELLVYSLKSSIMLALLYLPYVLMLRREHFFRLNRLMLLGILSLALVLPAWRYSYSVPAGEAGTALVAAQQLVGGGAEPADAPAWTVWRLLALLNIIGMAGMMAFRACQLLRIRRAIRGGSLWRQRQAGGTTVYCHAADEPSFSWMHSIVVGQRDYAEHRREVLLHEQAHICCRHSHDILLLAVVEIVQWWNPLVYRVGESLRNVHEYEADSLVLQQGIDMGAYQQLLLQKVLAGTKLPFANHFNRNSVVKRIAMMRRPPSSPWARGKALYVLPLTAFALVVSATPIIEPVLIIDGREVSREQMEQILPDSISHVDVLKGASATTFFGVKGQGGAVIVSTKKHNPQQP